jgi:ferric-dicitrate binding protein FerR (iron transport regulator)
MPFIEGRITLMMHNQEYSSVEDFVFDPSFKNWVLKNADQTETLFWEEWAARNADKLELLNVSRSIIYSLSVKRPQLSAAELEQEIESIVKQLPLVESTVPPASEVLKLPAGIYFRKWLRMAAMLLLMLSAGYFYWYWQHAGTASYNSFYAANEKSLIEYFNNTNKPQLFNLPDGSTALLESKSRLSYSLNKDESGKYAKRELFLEGGCFFTVQKDPSQPFIVYTNTIVTKVLGTSFRVSAYSKQEKATIEVRTGKVSVYRKEDFKKEASRPNELGGLLLLPNQQVVYNSGSSRLIKSLVPEPVIVVPQAVSTKLSFDEAPLTEVFQRLEQDYNIKIIYDEAVVANCAITATFGNEGFYQKLSLICKSINGRYESIDGSIVIFSNGCK